MGEAWEALQGAALLPLPLAGEGRGEGLSMKQTNGTREARSSRCLAHHHSLWAERSETQEQPFGRIFRSEFRHAPSELTRC